MLKMINKQISIDGTEKFLLGLDDGSAIEAVLMKHDYGVAACISTQVGCNMGCVFCASGLKKKVRSLTSLELYSQLETLDAEFMASSKEHISRLAVMGTGEPFDNCEEVFSFLSTISSGRSEIFIAPRHITVSSCGIIPGIEAFSCIEPGYNLAISLHAPNNDLRSRLMPVNKKYPVEAVLDAALAFALKKKRRVALEYLLIDGLNDTESCAKDLAALLKTICSKALDEGLASAISDLFYVNLIPLNKVSGMEFESAAKEKALVFYDILMKNGIKSTLRKERGSDISAACGQLTNLFLTE